MRTLAIEPQDAKIRELIDAADQEPVAVLENGKLTAIVLSPREFERLDEHDRIRREAKARLKLTLAAMHAEAAACGLTDAEAERLIADDAADGR